MHDHQALFIVEINEAANKVYRILKSIIKIKRKIMKPVKLQSLKDNQMFTISKRPKAALYRKDAEQTSKKQVPFSVCWSKRSFIKGGTLNVYPL